MTEYKCEFLNEDSGTSHRAPAVMEDLLNERAEEGWQLRALKRIPIGWLIVFEKVSA